MAVIFSFFHTTVVWKSTTKRDHAKKKSWNQLFSKFVYKYSEFTKKCWFFRKNRDRGLQHTVWKISQNRSHADFSVKPFLQFFCLTFFGKWGFSSLYVNYRLSLSLWKCWLWITFQFHLARFCHMYVPYSMLKIVSKLVKSTPCVLLRSSVDIGFALWLIIF